MERSAPLPSLPCPAAPRAPIPLRVQRGRPRRGPRGGGPARWTPVPHRRSPAALEGYGLQTSRRHQLRGRVVCPRQKKTVAASAGYGTGCSSSAPSSAPRSASGLSGGDAPGPDTGSAFRPGTPGLAGDAPAAAAAGPGAGAPRGTRTSSAACTPSVMVAASSTCGVTGGDRDPGTTPLARLGHSGAAGTAAVAGMSLSSLIRDKCAPRPRPPPPSGEGWAAPPPPPGRRPQGPPRRLR